MLLKSENIAALALLLGDIVLSIWANATTIIITNQKLDTNFIIITQALIKVHKGQKNQNC